MTHAFTVCTKFAREYGYSVGWMVLPVLLGIQWSGNEVLYWSGLQKFRLAIMMCVPIVAVCVYMCVGGVYS